VANEGAGYAFLGHALGFFFFIAYLDYRSSEIANTGFPSPLWIFVRIYIFHLHFRRQVLVFLKQVFAFTKPGALVEIRDSCVLLQPLYDFRGLLRKAVTFIGGRVIGFVVTIGEYV